MGFVKQLYSVRVFGLFAAFLPGLTLTTSPAWANNPQEDWVSQPAVDGALELRVVSDTNHLSPWAAAQPSIDAMASGHGAVPAPDTASSVELAVLESERVQPTTLAQVNSAEELRQSLYLDVPSQLLLRRQAISPGTTITVPSAFGFDRQQGYIAAGVINRNRFQSNVDGSIAVGVGVGDAREAIGLQIDVSSFNFNDDFLGDGAVGFKVHHAFTDDLAVAIGVENLTSWGDASVESSLYGVVTQVVQLHEDPQVPFSQLALSIGLGGGRFRSEADVSQGRDSINVFGSLAFQVAEPAALITEWNGQDLNVGISVVPLIDVPLALTIGANDLTGNAGDGARFSFGVGYGFSF
jgi:hypothetical protein